MLCIVVPREPREQLPMFTMQQGAAWYRTWKISVITVVDNVTDFQLTQESDRFGTCILTLVNSKVKFGPLGTFFQA